DQSDQMVTIIEETEDPETGDPVVSVRSLEEPISIESDDDFIANGFLGSGTEEDPYLIESYCISSDSVNLIYVTGTTAHFIIRNCKLDGLTQNWEGIYFENVENGVIENNVIENTHWGIKIHDSAENEVIGNEVHQNEAGIVLWIGNNNNEIVDNVVFNNLYEGIGLHYSDNNNVSENHIFDCNSGIILYEYSDHNNITWNEINNNYAEGVGLNDDNNYNLVSNNEIYENGVGVTIQDESDNNEVVNNKILDSEGYGIYIAYAASENLIKWNDIIENNQENCQAFDNGLNNVFEFNYWSDWISPDVEDPIGIVDFPYLIDGYAENEDPYPRTNEIDNSIQKALHLIDDVNDLVDEKVLNKGQGQSLTFKLHLVIFKIKNGEILVASLLIQSFINQMQDFIDNEIISQEEGEILITKASSIIN
ncbi:MAG: nitrous oxide reductase family maturation protein NosD, partial [Candidatus Thorarchaeota archaeon]